MTRMGTDRGRQLKIPQWVSPPQVLSVSSVKSVVKIPHFRFFQALPKSRSRRQKNGEDQPRMTRMSTDGGPNLKISQSVTQPQVLSVSSVKSVVKFDSPRFRPLMSRRPVRSVALRRWKDGANPPSNVPASPVRGGIFIENHQKKKKSPVRGDIFQVQKLSCASGIFEIHRARGRNSCLIRVIREIRGKI